MTWQTLILNINAVACILITIRLMFFRKPELTDTACDWVDIIYLTEHDIAVLDKQTKRDILVHNKSVQANCAKKIN